MDLSNLQPAKGSVKNKTRLGRGQGSGKGGTSTRGTKGAKSRSGYHQKIGFEGGQMPLVRRLPKFGFKNFNRKEYAGINIDVIQSLVEKTNVTEMDVNFFIECGLVSKHDLVKIIGRGELKTKVNIKAHAFTESAVRAIEALGGTATKI